MSKSHDAIRQALVESCELLHIPNPKTRVMETTTILASMQTTLAGMKAAIDAMDLEIGHMAQMLEVDAERLESRKPAT